VAEGVAGLALRHRTEQRSDIGVALYVRLLGEVEIAAVRLALAGECLFQVALGLGSLSAGTVLSFPYLGAECLVDLNGLGLILVLDLIALRHKRLFGERHGIGAPR